MIKITERPGLVRDGVGEGDIAGVSLGELPIAVPIGIVAAGGDDAARRAQAGERTERDPPPVSNAVPSFVRE